MFLYWREENELYAWTKKQPPVNEQNDISYLSDSCTTPMESDASAVTVSASSFSRCWAWTNDWQICVAALFTLFQYLPARNEIKSYLKNT